MKKEGMEGEKEREKERSIKRDVEDIVSLFFEPGANSGASLLEDI